MPDGTPGEPWEDDGFLEQVIDLHTDSQPAWKNTLLDTKRVMRDLALSFADMVEEDDPDGPGNLLAVGLRHDADGFAAFAAAFYIAATTPAGSEVREEWGVRWEADHHGEMRQNDSWFDTQAKRDSFCSYFNDDTGTVLATATRSAASVTTPWEQVDE